MGLAEEMIGMLRAAPAGQIDECFRVQCREFDGDDPVRFLRNLRDEMVHAGGCTDFVIRAISAALAEEPEETPDEMMARRAELEARYGA